MSTTCKEVNEICTQSVIRILEAISDKEIAQNSYDVVATHAILGFNFYSFFTPDGKNGVLGACEMTDETVDCTKSGIHLWKVSTGKEVTTMTHNGDLFTIVSSPDGKYIASTSGYGPTRIWEASTGKEIASLNEGATVITFSPDGKYLVSNFQGYNAKVWEVTTGHIVVPLFPNTIIDKVAFSPDGKYLVSGGFDRIARVWDISTGREISHMSHESYIRSVAFSPEGKYVISSSDDHTVRVWETNTGNEIARMIDPEDLSSVAFSPDGKYVISESGLGNVHIWFWQPDDLIVNACADLPRNLTRAEWTQFIGNVLPYEAVCDSLPIE